MKDIRTELMDERFQAGPGGGHLVPLSGKRYTGYSLIRGRCSVEVPTINNFLSCMRFGVAWRGQVMGLPASCSLGPQNSQGSKDVAALLRQGMVENMENALHGPPYLMRRALSRSYTKERSPESGAGPVMAWRQDRITEVSHLSHSQIKADPLSFAPVISRSLCHRQRPCARSVRPCRGWTAESSFGRNAGSGHGTRERTVGPPEHRAFLDKAIDGRPPCPAYRAAARRIGTYPTPRGNVSYKKSNNLLN